MPRNKRGEILTAATVISMIVLGVVSTVTISYFKQRQSYRSSAAIIDGGPNPTATRTPTRAPTSPNGGNNPTQPPSSGVAGLPSCKAGSYSDSPSSINNCNNSCTVPCTKCRINSTPKWECPASNPGGGGDNIPACGNYMTYNNANNCKTETKCSKNCSSCSIPDPYGGKYIKWFCASAGQVGGPTWNPNKLTPTITPRPTTGPIRPRATNTPTLPAGSNCALTNCKNLSFGLYLNQLRLNKPIYYGKSNGSTYYTNTASNCTGASMGDDMLKEYCIGSATPTLRSNPTTTATPKPTATKIPALTDAKTATRIPTPTMAPTAVPAGGNNPCGTGIWTDANNNDHVEQKVPCTLSSCGGNNCPSHQVFIAAGGIACCFQSAIDTCQNAQAICGAPPVQRFVYPQTSVQQALTGVQTTATGETIDCNVNTCIVQ